MIVVLKIKYMMSLIAGLKSQGPLKVTTKVTTVETAWGKSHIVPEIVLTG